MGGGHASLNMNFSRMRVGLCFYKFVFSRCQGIEVVDGQCKLSCVTTNVHSDWSTQTWPTNRLAIRVYKLGNDFVVSSTRNPHSEEYANCIPNPQRMP